MPEAIFNKEKDMSAYASFEPIDPTKVFNHTLPLTIKENDKTSIYVRSFCLKCKKVDDSVIEYKHDNCPGPVIIVHERFDHSSALDLNQAVVKVNKTINKLSRNVQYLNEVRAKYKVNPNEEIQEN